MKDEKYLKWIRQQPCGVCGRFPSDPHHLRDPNGKHTRRFSDLFVIPLCRKHHREVHDHPTVEKIATPTFTNEAIKYRGIYEREFLGGRNKLSSGQVKNSLQDVRNNKEEE
jgi:hypothetical protein